MLACKYENIVKYSVYIVKDNSLHYYYYMDVIPIWAITLKIASL